MNLPNQITIGRLVLTIVFLVMLSGYQVGRDADCAWILNATFWIFIVAAVSDILDGYLARKQNQVTSFGRILDPFVDKMLVCGAFVLLIGQGFVDGSGRSVTGLSAWMVVLVVARELMVSGLRGFSESKGKPYAANYWGKAKMLIQSMTIPLIIRSLGSWRGIEWVVTWRTVMIWLTVGVTAASVVSYLYSSRDALAERSRG